MPSNHLYKEMIRVIRQVRPRAFLFENVRGLMSGRWTPEGEKGEIWRDVCDAFQRLGDYETRPALVQARDYGVPQNRPRVLIVGIRRDQGWKAQSGLVADGLLPQPFGGAPDLADLLGDLVDPDFAEHGENKQYLWPATTDIQRELRTKAGKLMGKGTALTEQLYSKHSGRVAKKFAAMHASGGQIHERFRTRKFAQRLLPAHWRARRT